MSRQAAKHHSDSLAECSTVVTVKDWSLVVLKARSFEPRALRERQREGRMSQVKFVIWAHHLRSENAAVITEACAEACAFANPACRWKRVQSTTLRDYMDFLDIVVNHLLPHHQNFLPGLQLPFPRYSEGHRPQGCHYSASLPAWPIWAHYCVTVYCAIPCWFPFLNMNYKTLPLLKKILVFCFGIAMTVLQLMASSY